MEIKVSNIPQPEFVFSCCCDFQWRRFDNLNYFLFYTEITYYILTLVRCLFVYPRSVDFQTEKLFEFRERESYCRSWIWFWHQVWWQNCHQTWKTIQFSKLKLTFFNVNKQYKQCIILNNSSANSTKSTPWSMTGSRAFSPFYWAVDMDAHAQ